MGDASETMRIAWDSELSRAKHSDSRPGQIPDRGTGIIVSDGQQSKRARTAAASFLLRLADFETGAGIRRVPSEGSVLF